MAFLVRKIMHRAAFDDEALKQTELGEISSDIPTSEFRTTKSTLSTWYIEDLESINKAILAILLSSSEINRTDFIIMDTDELDKKNFTYENTEPGVSLPIESLESIHYDIVNLTLNKLTDCAEIYINTMNEYPDKRIFRLNKKEAKDIIKKAFQEDIIDENRANTYMKAALTKLKSEL